MDEESAAALRYERAGPATQGGLWSGDYREARQFFERENLTRKLREFGGNVTRTAVAIGLERQSLLEKIKKLGVLRP